MVLVFFFFLKVLFKHTKSDRERRRRREVGLTFHTYTASYCSSLGARAMKATSTATSEDQGKKDKWEFMPIIVSFHNTLFFSYLADKLKG
jgi:hypothetical protein